MAEGGDGREARTGNALWTLLVGAVLLLMELIVLAALMPADWSAQVRNTELTWLRAGLGERPAALVVARAECWYEGLFAETVLVEGSYRITLPNAEDESRSGALAPLATLPLWAWVAERLGVIWAALYQVLQRLALLLAWWPLLALLLAAAWGEGVLCRHIGQAGFAYASPLVNAYALRGSSWSCPLPPSSCCFRCRCRHSAFRWSGRSSRCCSPSRSRTRRSGCNHKGHG